MSERLTVRAITPDDWPIIEGLFGAKGACGGCWCMLWRISVGRKEWEARLHEPNRRAFRKLVKAGEVSGCLAFRGDQPVGWCSIGRRADFPGLERKQKLQSEWDERTWSVTCFYIPAKERGKGVATALLKEAIRVARKAGARSLEAYPVTPKPGVKMPAAFAWTGVPALFESAGFRCVIANDYQPLYRKEFR